MVITLLENPETDSEEKALKINGFSTWQGRVAATKKECFTKSVCKKSHVPLTNDYVCCFKCWFSLLFQESLDFKRISTKKGYFPPKKKKKQKHMQNMRGFLYKIGLPPKSSISIGFAMYKPCSLGYPYFWKHPNITPNQSLAVQYVLAYPPFKIHHRD